MKSYTQGCVTKRRFGSKLLLAGSALLVLAGIVIGPSSASAHDNDKDNNHNSAADLKGANGNGVGPVGLVGPAGPMGPVGPAGPAGAVGPAGPAGAVGPAGPAGAVGPAGPAGAVGPIGLTGLQGEIGPAGPAGPSGVAGDQGPQGPEGPHGQDGQEGPQGQQGLTGLTGSRGDQGPAGPAGTTGQNAGTLLGSATLTSSATVTVVPGLAASITVPDNAVVLVQSTGGVLNAASTSIVEIGLYGDGILQNGGRRQIAVPAGSVQYWNIGQAMPFGSGVHTVAIQVRDTNGIHASISGGDGAQLQGTLTVTILKK